MMEWSREQWGMVFGFGPYLHFMILFVALPPFFIFPFAVCFAFGFYAFIDIGHYVVFGWVL